MVCVQRGQQFNHGVAVRGVRRELFIVRDRGADRESYRLRRWYLSMRRLRGTLDGMDTTVITELAEYYEKEIGYTVPSRTPFVGKNFNVTRRDTQDGMYEE